MENNGSWERDIIEKIALSALEEQKKARKWRIFFRASTLLLILIVVWWLFGKDSGHSMTASGKHIAEVQLKGEISTDNTSAEKIIQGLDDAYEDPNTVAIILRINSPGGSPVQAGQIYDEIKRLKRLHASIPVYAVVEDLCASGAYYVASATDKIFVDKASIVGSIGVIMNGFGFTDTMKKLGIERRLIIAGENKAFLDPFSPENPKQMAYAKDMLEQIHQQFIQAVRQGRGARLKETPDMFSGLVWTGERSIQLGLTDALGSVKSVARDVIKVKNIIDYTPTEDITDRIAKRLGSTESHINWQSVMNILPI
ncbi:MAG: S49 family peptidase [Ferrovum sp. 37-45-19]|uniref:S49 family peptidase n=1 Tax=Ferrovum sp. JA12 TaxID=1356299 RepID=UPI000703534F|nr:S49 family peptidase [Ferrovum sp. JA12]OYV78853.1 MAG: S49 family peptidase [Ferrovum sp. 21-44-67]OYV93496.1 MAG: S49 family peptidase [Ferrovum sp. 37-45-19]HQT82205.1 S49 family peptidase [Ferrovaceae bacterium]KRH79938.1 putative signal peptide peptidase SppA [Ferrovum sp. JA12]HQU07288.1 S49 family peptidase [Ferrovaceae bacterium]